MSGAAAGLRHGASALWAGHDVRSSVAAARDAAARRERDLAEELAPPSGRIRDRAPRAEPAPSDEDASLPEPGEPEA